MWAHGFRDSFTPLQGVLFTFPSRYLFAIGLWRVFSLGGWARRIHTGFHVPRATQGTSRPPSAARTGLSPSAGRLSRRFRSPQSCHHLALQPPHGLDRAGLGSSPLARRYWGNHFLFSLPPGTKMFQFPGFASAISADGGPSDRRVAPFGHLRVTGRLHLAGAFRSLPRPSSPSRAKASAVRPFFLSPPVRAKSAHRTFTWFLYFPRSAGRIGTPLHACVLLFQHVNERAGHLPLSSVWRITDSNR